MLVTTSHQNSVIELLDVSRDFYDGRQTRRVLHPLTLGVYAGDFTIISGPSGSGKTTLLTILALILKPTNGRVVVMGQDVTRMSEDTWASLRLRHYGFVFQTSALVPALSVMDNVLIAAAVQGDPITPELRQRATASLTALGLGDFTHVKIGKLSGGQKQRVAIARALVNGPQLILCDEPTSSLDVESSAMVLESLKQLSTQGCAVVLVTHDQRVFPYADRLIQLVDGTVAADTRSPGVNTEVKS